LGGSEKIFFRAAYMNGIEVRAESPGKFRRVRKRRVGGRKIGRVHDVLQSNLRFGR
jgi:hypothetical protein